MTSQFFAQNLANMHAFFLENIKANRRLFTCKNPLQASYDSAKRKIFFMLLSLFLILTTFTEFLSVDRFFLFISLKEI